MLKDDMLGLPSTVEKLIEMYWTDAVTVLDLVGGWLINPYLSCSQPQPKPAPMAMILTPPLTRSCACTISMGPTLHTCSLSTALAPVWALTLAGPDFIIDKCGRALCHHCKHKARASGTYAPGAAKAAAGALYHSPIFQP